MKRICGLAIAVVLAAWVFPAACGDDQKQGEEKPAGEEKSFTGTLATASTAGGQAALRVDREDKSSPQVTLALWAEGELGQKLADLLKAKAHVTVGGVVAPDGVNMKVIRIEEAPTKGKRGGAKKDDKKKDPAKDPNK